MCRRPRVYFLAILVDFSLGKGTLFGDFGQRNVKLGNSCKGDQIYENFGPENANFTKIDLAKGAIFKLWAVNPYSKFNREPPPPRVANLKLKFSTLLL